MNANAQPVCSKCKKQIPPPPYKFTSGYGLNQDSQPVCYECCAEEDKQYMRDHGKITLYLSIDRDKNTRKIKSGSVTNWPGSLRFENLHVRVGEHNWGLNRYDTWFIFENHIWHGVTYGDMTQICHCKRTKQTVK